ncbi:Hydantoinase B/oxoprolinase [Phytophthora cactorum]|nr:Hydantoinase B/oxoprolinase [Phytophthora cactorum]
MPPLSKTLSEEGAVGEFREKEITDILLQKGRMDDQGRPCIGTPLCRVFSASSDGLHELHQQAAEIAVRNMLHEFSLQKKLPEVGVVQAEDFMDDGTRISLQISIDRRSNSAVFDFAGTGPEFSGMCVSEGGSILNPSDNAAVVGGNVLTSQRITDVILKAFGASGAGPSWNGRSGIHTHMTNTRITDPEILEKRFPVLRASDRVPRGMTVSILSERRAFQPYGLEGGAPGARGINILQRQGGRTVNLGGKNTVDVLPGEILTLYTPGGGGFGAN